MLKSVAEFLKDPKGQLSSMRMAAIFATFIVLVVWAVSSLTEIPEGLADIPMTVVGLLALLWGAKQVQRFYETREVTRQNQ